MKTFRQDYEVKIIGTAPKQVWKSHNFQLATKNMAYEGSLVVSGNYHVWL